MTLLTVLLAFAYLAVGVTLLGLCYRFGGAPDSKCWEQALSGTTLVLFWPAALLLLFWLTLYALAAGEMPTPS